MPAKAGIHLSDDGADDTWVPACAGTTTSRPKPSWPSF